MKINYVNPFPAREDVKIVGAMLDDPIGWHYSLSICRATGIAVGTAYPALARLEKSGWLESRWDTAALGAPRRRLYRLTGAGQRLGLEGVGKMVRRPRRWRFGVPAPQEQLG
jgi:PadR family transcriptional regulator